jgi:carbon monoxide dehydrogenase subunit G
MKLQHTGQETIPATRDVVWAFITDPARIAQCLPDVVSTTVQDATHFQAVVNAGVGPVRGRLTFKFEMLPDPAAHRMDMKISGGGFGSVLDLRAGADLAEGGEGATILNWSGEADMRGPVAAVGGRVLDSQARKLIAQTFANVRERLTANA